MQRFRRSVSLWLCCLLLVLFPGGSAWAEDEGNPSPAARELQRGSLEHDGMVRTYEFYVPSSYDGSKPVPLLFSFHGTGWTGSMQRDLDRFPELAEREGFIVVYPDSTTLVGDIPPGQLSGYLTQWNDGREWTLQFAWGIDDVGYVSALIDKFTAEYNVDERRIYAAGMSNGAVFAQRLAVELSDRIAAAASVTGPLAEWVELHSDWKRPITVILVMGTADPIVPYNWRTDQTIEYWVKRNGTSAEPKVETLPQHADDPTVVHRKVYGGGRYGTEVILYEVENGGHAWPGGPQYYPVEAIGWSSGQMDASEVIWEHFRQHVLPDPVYPDVPWSHWAAAEIDWLTHRGLVAGNPDGTFGPGETLSRAEAASMLAKALNLDLADRPDPGFVDVDQGSVHYAAIAAVAAEGWMEANDRGEFHPDWPMTREQTAIALVRAFGLEGDGDFRFKDIAPYYPGYQAVRTLAANGLVNGYGDFFRPGKPITKAEFSVFLYRALTGEKAR